MSTVNFPPPGSAPERGFMDKTFGNTNIIVLVIFAFCCGCSGIAPIFGGIGMALCKEPLAKRNAKIVTAIGGTLFLIAVIINVYTRINPPAVEPGVPAPVVVPGLGDAAPPAGPAPANP